MKKLIPIVLVITSILLAAGCFTVPKEEIKIFRYAMESKAHFEPADTTLPYCLHVTAFGAASVYKGSRVIYKDAEGHTDHYYYHRWLAPPEDQLADLLAQNFFDWNFWGKGVFLGECGFIPTHEIRCHLEKLAAVNVKKNLVALMSVEVFFAEIDPKTFEKRLIFQKKYSLSYERENNTAGSFIDGCSANADEWMRLLRDDIYNLLVTKPTQDKADSNSTSTNSLKTEQTAPDKSPLPPPTENQ